MKDFSPQLPCPCQSNLTYAECCQPFHLKQAFPATAEALMRSRYCAYTLVNIDYVVETTVPSQQPLLPRDAMQDWGENTHWTGLEIVKHQPNISKIHSLMEFKAYYQQDQEILFHHEHSLFVKIDGRWYFFDPTLLPPAQKQPCVCGSGKKFKHCCGAYNLFF